MSWLVGPLGAEVANQSNSGLQPLFPLLETSSLSDFAQIWLCSRLKQWPNHFSILFSRKVSTGFTCASFRLMWSNLAHLSTLKKFWTVRHCWSDDCFEDLSFNSTGNFLSHINPNTSFDFIHPILILLLASSYEPPSLANSDSMYLKDVTVGSSASTLFTVVSVSFEGLGKYYVFVLLILSTCLSNTTLHVSRSPSTSSRVIAHSTRSSANIITQGGSFSMFSVRTSIIIMNKRGLRADPWCTVVPVLGDPRRERPPDVYGHGINVLTHLNVKLPAIDGHLPNADADSHLYWLLGLNLW